MHPVVSNNKEAMLDLVACAPAGRVWNEPGFVAYFSGLPDSIFNAIIEIDLSREEAIRKIEMFADYCRNRQVPFTAFLTDDSKPEDLPALLESAGLSFSHKTPGMVYPSLQEFRASPPPEELSFKSCQNAQQRVDFHELFGIFEMTEPTYDLYCELLRQLPEKIDQIVGYANGVPVCTSAAYFGTDCAGIYTVATHSEARGKGYGRAVTEYCLDLARQRGYDSAVLTSSKMGFRVYEKIGFKQELEVSYFESQ